ncbi:hypothetical protein GCM10022261_08300 [Brevibacterium daeguense]|uniref:Phosphonate transport system substrate-binding protein n=1 Tax=Brevibacterium daeguense TaxID=909936 RepID=A0ABP8EH53_9MICO|nr:phosphate/phosphite/phosphonate ABC transporter substrate-binding protein [Brevibacterium daeguense]
MASTRSSRRITTAVFSLLAAGSLAACGGGEAEANSADNSLRFAVTDLQGMEELQREYGAFQDVFEEKSGMEMEFFAVTDRTAAAAALQNDEVDIVFTGPAEYVVLHERTDAEPVVAIERPGYRSCIYTSAESEVDSLDDLKGEKVAMSDVGSTSGHLGPSQIFVDAGIDPMNDLEVLTVGDTVHEALKRGDVAAVGIGCHDYEEFMQTDDPADFPILTEGDQLPPDLLMASSSLDEEKVETVRQTFTENFDELLTAMLEGKDNAKYEGAALVEVTDEDYDVVRSMYRAIGADDFTEFVGD